MMSCIWRLAAAGLLCAGVNGQVLADGQGGSPLQSRPDEVRQTQPPRTGYYEDIPRREHGYRPGHVIDRFADPYWRVPYAGQDYFYSNGYWYRPQGPRYVVVTPPYELMVYPASGQSPRQLDRDRYECHRWAVQQTGFDPASARHAPAAQVMDNYRRAQGACLNGRGYSVM
ncbi:hypothetical protein ACIQUS_17270 [Pseudomonas sp. NPDC090755]|uniref:hypothetical protein n=1 Tax=Pseudomonas sp. NPDC090755 TaxID=3364481 RepID=UPI00383AC611